MRTSRAGIELIKKFEGLRLEAYKCPADVWTIGYGTTEGVYEGLKITKTQADALLKQDLMKFEKAVNSIVKVPLSQNQFDALVCFTYNVGEGALRKSSLVRLLNAGDYNAVPAQLMRWTKAGGRELSGLVKRRRAEAALWRGIDAEGDAGPMPQVVDEPKGKPMSKSRIALAGGASSVLTASGALIEPINQLRQQALDVKSFFETLLENPSFYLSLAVIGLCVYIIYERWRKSKDEGV